MSDHHKHHRGYRQLNDEYRRHTRAASPPTTNARPTTRITLLIALLFAMVGTLSLATANPAAAQPDAPTGTLTGTVTDAATGAPIEGATVSVDGGHTATTGGDGSYSIADLPAGSYGVTASASGYTAGAGSATIAEGETATANIALDPIPEEPADTTAASTTTTPDDTAPQEPADTTATSTTTPNDADDPTPEETADTTTAAGTEDPVPQQPADTTVTSTATEDTDFQEPADTTVSPTDTGDPITQEPATGTLTGRVFDSSIDLNAPVSGATVSIDGTSHTTTSSGDGSYSIADVPAGSYDVTAAADGYETTTRPVDVVAGETTTLNIGIGPTDPFGGTVTVTVTDSQTGDPIADATVSLIQNSNLVRTATTGSDGTVTLAEVPAGSYSVYANAAGYLPPFSGTAEVVSGETITVDFALDPVPPPGALAGTVADSDTGDPIAGAAITVGDPVVPPGPTQITGSDGSYRFDDLSPGSRSVTVSADGYETAFESVEIVGGETITLDVALDPTPTGSVSGTIADSDTGDPIGGATVRVKVGFGDSANETTTTTGDDGHYSVGALPAGSLEVVVSAPGYSDGFVLDVLGEDEAMIVNVALDPLPAGSLHGVVTDRETGAPIFDATVTVDADGEARTTRTSPGGFYYFDPLPDGLYVVSVAARGYVDTTTLADIHEESVTTLDIALAPRPTGTLTGTITDRVTGEPIALATVSIDGTDHTTTTGSDGSYTIADVPAGSYDVTVTADGYETATARLVEVSEGETARLDFALDPIPESTGTLTGTVREAYSPAGPIDGATVTVSVGDNARVATTGADGTYSLAELPAGSYDVTASAPGFETETKSVDIVAGETVTLNFGLLPASTGDLTGTVFDSETDAPIAGATVSLEVDDIILTSTTGSLGGYSFGDVPLGTYEVTATAAEYVASTLTAEIARGESTIVDFGLDSVPATVDTTVTLSADPAAPVEGEDVTLTAIVEADGEQAGEPAGTVEFFDGDESLGVAQLASPASLTVSNLAAGEHQLSARYSGNGAFAGAESDVLVITIAAAPTSPGPTTTTTTEPASPTTSAEQPTATTAPPAESSTPTTSNAAVSGTLPATGTSTTAVLIGGAILLVAGAAFLVSPGFGHRAAPKQRR